MYTHASTHACTLKCAAETSKGRGRSDDGGGTRLMFSVTKPFSVNIMTRFAVIKNLSDKCNYHNEAGGAVQRIGAPYTVLKISP